MPYTDFDSMGNYLGGYGLTDGYETEEERRKRLEKEAANTLVGKTEVQTWADGSVTRKITEELPPTTSPLGQGVTPVAPDDLYQRLRQVESGNRDFTPSGQPVTSPAGAMFAGQVMPSTAAQPGFGIRPAQAQTPDEYNRVSREYFDAMLQRYGGDQQKALAAYNAGPGRVDRNIAANQGQMNVAQLPGETQGYLGKILGGVRNALIPSAQAAEAPVDPAELRRRQALAQRPPLPAQTQAAQTAAPVPQAAPAPAAVPQAAPAPAMETSPYSLAAGVPPSQGIQIPGVPTTPVGQPSTQSINQYQQAQDNPAALLQLRSDESQPTWIRERAGARAYEMLDAEVKRKQAEQQAAVIAQAAAAGDRKASLTMAKELQKQEGSWLKMILLGFLSPDLAGEEAVKLGFGNRWQSTTDLNGNPVLIETNVRGLPLQGFKADGSKMTDVELISYGGGKKDLDIVGGTYVNDKTGEVGRVVTDKRTGQSYIQTDTGRKPMSGFRPQASTGSLADMRTRAIQDINLKLQGKGVEEQMAILRDYNKMLVGQGYPPVQPGEVGISVPQIGGAPAATGAPAPTPVAPAAPGAPAPQAAGPIAPAPMAPPAAVPGAPAAPAQRPTQSQLEAQAAGAKKEAEVGAEDIATVRKNQGKAEQNADYLITKIDELITHPGFGKSVGVYDVGGIPVPYGATVSGMIPGSDVSDWRARFDEVKGQSFLNAIENLRGMGALSDREGAAATQAIQRMRDTQSEKEFKAAAKDFQEIIQRGIDRNRQKLGQEPKYGTAPESAGPTLSPADKARQELERRKRKQ